MNINIRMEGGLGDHLLANRFVPAILDKYPNASIKLFSDTEGGKKSLELILKLFSRFYKRGGEIIEQRKNKEYMVQTQFGVENLPSHINNQTDEILNKLFDCDKFYDLHVDGLKWLEYDFEWLRYYYSFPSPEIKARLNIDTQEKYILVHLYSRPDSPYNLHPDYVKQMLFHLSKVSKIIIIIEDKYKDYYSECLEYGNIALNTTNELEEIFILSKHCEAFLGIDSGIRYIPYHFGKPVFLYTSACDDQGNVKASHIIRWLLFRDNVLPMHFDIGTVCTLFTSILNNKAQILFPSILDNLNGSIVKRFYIDEQA